MSGQQNTASAPPRPLAQKHMAAPRERSVMLSALWDHKGSRTPRAQMRFTHRGGKKRAGATKAEGPAGGGRDLGTCRHVCVSLSNAGGRGGSK